MRSHFGTIKKLAPDYYHIFWTENGRKRSKRFRGTQTQARAFLVAREAEQGGLVSMTWGDYWDNVVEPSFSGLEEKTKSMYRWTWRTALKDHLDGREISTLTWRQVQHVISASPAPSTQQKAKRLLKKMCNMAVRDGMLQRNPVDASIKTAAPKRREKILLAAEELRPWLRAIKGHRYEPLVLLELGGGLRHEEACAMTRENIKRVKKYASVTVSRGLVTVDGHPVLKGTKNEFSRREVIIGAPFAGRLLELSKGKGALCPSPTGGGQGEYTATHFVAPCTVSQALKRFCKSQNIAPVRFGDMRSVFVTLHGEAGTPDSLVSMALGHADGGTTKARNYQQRTEKGLMLAADMLTDYLLSAVEKPVENV